MRTSILVACVLAGCAPRFTAVSQADWQVVPASERAALDRSHDAEDARIHAELDVALKAVADAPRPSIGRRPVIASSGWDDAVQRHERSKADALVRVTVATAEWERATRTLRAQRVAVLTAQLDVVRCMREVDRARAVDHHLLGSDTYDGAELRGQLARFEDRWFSAQHRQDAAQVAVRSATTDLDAAKETYAALVRRGPGASTKLALYTTR